MRFQYCLFIKIKGLSFLRFISFSLRSDSSTRTQTISAIKQSWEPRFNICFTLHSKEIKQSDRADALILRDFSLDNFDRVLMASFEEKTKDPSELMTAVIVQANTLVKNDYKGLDLLERAMGEVTNL